MGLKIYWFSQLNVRARQGRGKPPPFAPQFFETERRMRSISPSISCVSVPAMARRPVVRRSSASIWTVIRPINAFGPGLLRYQCQAGRDIATLDQLSPRSHFQNL